MLPFGGLPAAEHKAGRWGAAAREFPGKAEPSPSLHFAAALLSTAPSLCLSDEVSDALGEGTAELEGKVKMPISLHGEGEVSMVQGCLHKCRDTNWNRSR